MRFGLAGGSDGVVLRERDIGGDVLFDILDLDGQFVNEGPSQFRSRTEGQAAVAVVELFETAVAGAFLAAYRFRFHEPTALATSLPPRQPVLPRDGLTDRN
jgi:hypothetical protein